jgi:purine-nucleoside phosphorylase
VTYYDQVKAAADVLRGIMPDAPDAAVVLGSGLGAFADGLEASVSLAYERIPYWPGTEVAGHAGRIVAGRVGDRKVAVLSGRAHAYEGRHLRDVTFGIRVLGLLGTPVLILTNSAGGIRRRLPAGSLVVLDDHVNAAGLNPLAGPHDDRFGPRFPDMSEVYSRRLRELADAAGVALGIPTPHGIYAWVVGPSYETPAEIAALRTIGADLVGMSTVPEAIVARHMGIEVLGISCVANAAAGLAPRPLEHREVLAAAGQAAPQCAALVSAVIARL